MISNRATVDALRKQYPPGTRIKLEHMDDPYPVEPGTGGTVRFIDDLGQIGVDFDNGRSLSLIPGEDTFSIQHSAPANAEFLHADDSKDSGNGRMGRLSH